MIEPESIEDAYRLLPMQLGMLFHSVSSPESGVYVGQVTCRLGPDTNLAAFEKAWQRVIQRHAILRTSFQWEGLKEPLQHTHSQVPLHIEAHDWRDIAAAEQEKKLEAHLLNDRKRGLDLNVAPLMRLTLFTLLEDEYIFLWTHHHALLDGRARVIVLKEVSHFYEAFSRGQDLELPLPSSYKGHIEWFYGQDRAESEQYWRRLLETFTSPVSLALPFERAQTKTVERYGTWEVGLSTTLKVALQSTAQRYKVTVNILVQAAWTLLLSRYSGQDDIVFGETRACRRAVYEGASSVVGCLINTVPIRLRANPEESFVDLVKHLRAQHVEMRAHEDTPLVDIRELSGVSNSAQLFDSIVVFEEYELSAALQRQGSALWRNGLHRSVLTNYPLTLAGYNKPELSVQIAYDRLIICDAVAQRMAVHLQRLMEEIAANPESRLGNVRMLTEAEHQQVIVDWNERSRRHYQAGELIHDKFEAVAQKQGETTAVVWGQDVISYAQLNDRANQLANYLTTQGVSVEDRVGVCFNRSIDMVVALLAVLKAGGAYVPLDPSYPDERIRFMLQDSDAKVLLSENSLSHRLGSFQGTVILLDEESVRFNQQSTLDPHVLVHDDNIAYFIYTSGSTGVPKGVAITHRSAVVMLNWALEEFSQEDLGGVLASTSICFDLSVFELFAPLSCGGTVILVNNALDLKDLSVSRPVRLVNTVPSALAELLRVNALPATVRTVNLAGEALRRGLVNQIYEQKQVHSVYNLYGPSEDTTYSTFAKLTADPEELDVSIGAPIANTQAYVLDNSYQPVPLGVVGELFLAGDGLARGYWARPSLTADRFLPDPFSHLMGARMYRTGDRVRFLEDGQLQFIGRIDDQVKIRGYRIEPGEIETLLSRKQGVIKAAVVPTDDPGGGKRLVAYLELDSADANWESGLRSYLRQTLPDYMVPAIFVKLDELPLNPNGKIDRRSLPAVDFTSTHQSEEGAASETEQMLAAIWGEVLGMPNIAILQDFFSLGGHSLLAMRVVSRANQLFNIHISLRDLFDNPNIHQLAKRIDQELRGGLLSGLPPLKASTRPQNLPLSFAQQRMFFLQQFEPHSSYYNIPLVLRLEGPLHHPALEEALSEILRRHEVLRSRFLMVDETPVQLISAPHLFSIPLFHLEDLPAPEQQEQLDRIVAEIVSRPFDLAADALVRASLLRLSSELHIFTLTLHHIICDAWSMEVFSGELAALYQAYCNDNQSSLPDLPIQYADFALWQHQWLQNELLEPQLAYWKKQLADVPTLNLTTSRPRPPAQSHDGARHSFDISLEQLHSLKELCRREGVTLFMALLALFDLLLHRYSGQSDIVVGTPIAGRFRSETEPLIGFFLNTLVLRNDLSGNPSFCELLRRVKQVALAAYAHQHLPFEKLVEELQLKRDLSRTPLFQVAIVVQTREQKWDLEGLSVSVEDAYSGGAKFDLTLVLTETGAGIKATFEYCTELYEPETIKRMGNHFRRLVEEAAKNPDEAIAKLEMLGEEEREQLLVSWNDTRRKYGEGNSIVERFEEQVEIGPKRVAVEYEGEEFSYEELNQRANQLAHYLRNQGVVAETLVGICMERSVEMVVGLMGVLKAGGAYVPLDPAYPAERLAFMLKDSGVRTLLTQERLVASLPEHSSRFVCLDRDWPRISLESDENLAIVNDLDQLAYVIYTSGSTGQPKGAMNTHGGIANRLVWMQERFALSEQDRVLQKTPFSFDVSVWEFFWPLMHGAVIVMAKPGGHRDNDYLIRLIVERRITTLHFVPSMLRIFVEHHQVGRCTSLKTVIVSGEALTGNLEASFFTHIGAELYNLYGPTEAAVDVTEWACRRDGSGSNVPIGRPIANTQIYILDDEMRPVPVGLPGEMYIGGAQVARGYWERPGLTAERFIPDPFSDLPGKRLYRVGDLGRYRADGDIEFLGRVDHQEKIRGFRVEMEEIEAALRKHPAVEEAVVIAREYQPDDKRLVAYLMPDAERAATVKRLLRCQNEGLLDAHVLEELPNGMPVALKNKIETEFVYQEIFGEDSYIRHGITLRDGDCVFDVGANIGLFTLFVRQRCKDAKIYAFEPIPEIFDLLRFNTDLYGGDVKAFKCGLSDRSGQETFTYYPHVTILSGNKADAAEEMKVLLAYEHNKANENDATDRMLEEVIAARLASELVTCEMKTISSVIRENGIAQIDLLKIDVEKSERQVLLGIEEDDWPMIRQVVVEVQDIDDCLAWAMKLFERHGYRVMVEQELALQNTGIYVIYAIRDDEERKSALAESNAPPRENVWHSAARLKKELRGYLAERLPEYMVPADFVLLEAWPLLPNGKVDRQSLPRPDQNGTASIGATYVAPRTAVEQRLTQLFGEILKRDRIGIHDNFFESGGHSLLAMRVVSKMREALRVEMPIRVLFDMPTVAQLAEICEEALSADRRLDESGRQAIGRELEIGEITGRARPENLPLSFAQQRMFFLQQFEPHSSYYNIPLVLRLEGPLHHPALEEALSEILRRHEVLRSRFLMVDETPVQLISAPHLFSIPLFHLEDLPAPEQQEQLDRIVAEIVSRPFDLAADALVRASLLRLSSELHIFTLTLHHIICDAWSIEVFARELGVLYQAFKERKPSPLIELPIQYAEYAIWQRDWMKGEILDTQLQYWRGELRDAPRVELPLKGVRPPEQSHKGARRSFVIAQEHSSRLRELCGAHGVTLFMGLLSVFDLLLRRYTGEDHIVVGTPISGRTRGETEGLIGLFLNTLVVRVDMSGNPAFSDLLTRVRDVALRAYGHQEVPFEKLVEELQPERDQSRTPLFQVLLVVLAAKQENWRLEGLRVTEEEAYNGEAKFDLTMFVKETEAGLKVTIEYCTELFDQAMIEKMGRHFRNLVASAVSNPQSRIDEMEMLEDEERKQLLVDWNDTKQEYGEGNTIVEGFERQVERGPKRVAVEYEGEKLSYEELNRRANRLAHYLQKQGVGAGTLVGICMERSVEMLVGLLGVLKAGGAYLPLDPTYPANRLAFMIENANPQVLLTQKRLLTDPGKRLVGDLAANKRTIVFLDADWDRFGSKEETNPISPASPANLAYVIYTSGSSGLPKGVMVTREAIENFLSSMSQNPGLASDDVLIAVTTLSFDIAALELYLPLMVGARVILVSRDKAADAHSLRAAIIESGATAMQATPVTWSVLLDAGWQGGPSFKALCGGEALPAELAARLADSASSAWNLYGPTETTVWSTLKRILPGESVTVGRPIANTQVYVLNSSMQPAPIGVAGELYIGGSGVARGYLNRAELTAERFIPDPFSGERGGRLYKTGDLARYAPDGDLEILGRIDRQTKIRGYRIELGEVESMLRQHAAVREATVVVREDLPGEKRLVAYVVCGAEQPEEQLADGEPSWGLVHELREFLEAGLPEYMMPSAFVRLEALPLTPNGKVDHKALPAPDTSRLDLGNPYVAPRTATERLLAGIWEDALKVGQVGIYDDFFELGGHSLLAMRVISRVRELLQIEVPLRSLFESRRVENFSRAVTIHERKPGQAEKASAIIIRIQEMDNATAQQALGESSLREAASHPDSSPRFGVTERHGD